ncbi:MAG: SinI family restriction endonuclease [Anaerolineae bacterium]|nr:SinI family restriction endonuclease [Anaerolineae bacterium]
MFDPDLARSVAEKHVLNDDEGALIPSFVEICRFLGEFPSELSWSRGEKPTEFNESDLDKLAKRYFDGYRRSDFPATPSTIPDEMVSVIMREAYGYTDEECEQIKVDHQRSMCAENCVGNLLERYINSILRDKNWYWCCGEFVKAIDFLSKNDDDDWLALQIKNRDNSENSSSSAIRDGTKIQKWFRSFSKDTKKGRPNFTNWDKLPPLMKGYDLSEDGFKEFVIRYINDHKPSE